MLDQLRHTHRFLLRHSVYPIALSSLLACAMFAGRVVLSRSWTYQFLVWNLFLAWVPYACSLWMAVLHEHHPRGWWYLILPGLLWLIFLPNAPYLITDLWHLDERPPVSMWYDIGLLATFAWTGCFLAIASLRSVQRVVHAFLGWVASWLFVAGALMLSGLGIYLGRFLRWNSWDLVTQPRSILADVAPRLLDPLGHRQAYGVTLMFAAFLLVCYLTFVSVQHHEPHDSGAG